MLRDSLAANARQSAAQYDLNRVMGEVLAAYGVVPVPAGAMD